MNTLIGKIGTCNFGSMKGIEFKVVGTYEEWIYCVRTDGEEPDKSYGYWKHHMDWK
jgi:hypothetical protein